VPIFIDECADRNSRSATTHHSPNTNHRYIVVYALFMHEACIFFGDELVRFSGLVF